MLDANDNIRGVVPDTVPMWFIKELRSLGLRMEGYGGWLHVAQNTLPSDSPQYRRFLAMLVRLGNTKVKVRLTWTGEGNLPYDSPNQRAMYYSYELMEQVTGLNPNFPNERPKTAFGEASWLVEAAVRMVEDPPESCKKARVIPHGRYMMSVEIQFQTLICYVSVFRKSTTPAIVTELD